MTENKSKDKSLLGPEERKDPGAWLKLARSDSQGAEKAWQALDTDERLRVVLSASTGGDRERLITMARDSRELVRRLTPDEFMNSVLEAGPDDAATLVAHSTDDQLTYLLDLTAWVKDRLSPQRYEAWLPLLVDAGSRRLLRWLDSSDPEVLVLLFASWFQVVKWLPSSEEQEPPDTLPAFTLDGLYFLDWREKKPGEMAAQILTILKSERPKLYQTIMEGILSGSANMIAEEAYRWRRGRLQDLGFPDREESLELWAASPFGEADWQDLPEKQAMGFLRDSPPRSDHVLNLLPKQETLPSLAAELPQESADILRAELAYVANCGVAALDADPTQPDAVARAAKESLGLTNLGLDILSGKDRAKAASILARMGLPALARQGAKAIREVNQRAHRLVNEGWLKDIPSGFHILDDPLDRRVAGLLFPRPRYHEPGLGQGREYRSFTCLDDLEKAKDWLDQAEFTGRLLFELLGISQKELKDIFERETWPEDPAEIKAAAVFGTWLARQALELPGLAPIPFLKLDRAVDLMQKGLKGPLGDEAAKSVEKLSNPADASLAGRILRAWLSRLSNELGTLNPEALLEPGLIWGLITER